MTRRSTLVGGPADGTVIETGAGALYRVADHENADGLRHPFLEYRRERIAFIVPAHLEATVKAGLEGVDVERRELVDTMTGERSVRLELEIWALPERLEAIRVELARVDRALSPLTFVELYDDTPVAERLKEEARKRLEALVELVTPGSSA